MIMKHNFKVTALLILIFLAAQIVGLALINVDIKGPRAVDPYENDILHVHLVQFDKFY